MVGVPREQEMRGRAPLSGALVSLVLGLIVVSHAAQGEVSKLEAPTLPERHATSNQAQAEGIEIRFSLRSLADGSTDFREGDVAEFRFDIRDTTTGTPLSSIYPAAWLEHRSGEAPDAETCQNIVETFMSGSILTPPEIDLNVYYVIALNEDATISVVDPLFGFGGTKLLAMAFLSSPGEDWALGHDQQHLFVSMPASNQVAVVETAAWKVVQSLDTGPRPSRTVLQADNQYLWVGHDQPRKADGPSGVNVIDVSRLSVVAEIPTGRGHHEIVVSTDNRHAYVTNADDGSVSVVDVRTLELLDTIATGSRPISIAYSALSRAAYVSHADGSIAVLGGATPKVLSKIDTDPGLGQIRVTPDGRFAIVVHPAADGVHVIDVATNRIIQSATIDHGPDQLAFSDELIYVRRRESEVVLMIPMDQIGEPGAPLPVVDFPGGQRPFGQVGYPSLAPSIVQAPGATAVLVANPADRTIYFYKEGMAAPMGSFKNYDRQPRAVEVIDRSLREVRAGEYGTVARLPRAGTYDVAFFLDSPRTVHCFEIEIEPNAELEAERLRLQPPTVEPLNDDRNVIVGEATPLQFRMIDPVTQQPRGGLTDVAVVVLVPGRWHQRLWAAEGPEGIYTVRVVPPFEGLYYSFVESETARLPLTRSPAVVLHATPSGESVGVTTTAEPTAGSLDVSPK